MRKLFYSRMAAQNIARSRRFFLPYLITGVLTVAMFYNMVFLATSPGVFNMPGADALAMILNLGCIIVGLFSVLFIFYTNSFLMKRRKKELGLYNVLGMEKRHISRVLAWETFFTAVISVPLGLIVGVLFSKLLMLVLFRLLSFPVPFGFAIGANAAVTAVVLFACIYLLALLSNLARLRRSKPIELLKGGDVGEREPKTKKLMAVLGAISLLAGYAIALSIRSPLSALQLFFLSVILIFLGTYLLFTAGSIAWLKMMRRRKRYYYQTRHFISVSGMLYRMKQNAVGLANICVLATMVLVMISTTVCLYIGTEDSARNRCPADVSITVYSDRQHFDSGFVSSAALGCVEESGLEVTSLREFDALFFAAQIDGNTLLLNVNDDLPMGSLGYVCVITGDEYARLTGESVSLGQGQALAMRSDGQRNWQSVVIGGAEYEIAGWLESPPVSSEYMAYVSQIIYLVVPGDADAALIHDIQQTAYGFAASNYGRHIYIDLTGAGAEKLACYNAMSDAIDQAAKDSEEKFSYSIDSLEATTNDFYAVYGGFLFLGLFLGILFLMATVLIIYYKQISEGYEDKERFEIMRKVGLSRADARRSVRSQILTVFFLPLAASFVHLAASYNMMSRLLALMNLSNGRLFVVCLIVTCAAFAVVYAAVYGLTARAYYRIVGR